MDKFLATDKDNVFVAWKTTTVDRMSYVRDATLTYDLRLPEASLSNWWEETVTMNLQVNWNIFLTTPRWPMIKPGIRDITTTELNATLRYAPGETL